MRGDGPTEKYKDGKTPRNGAQGEREKEGEREKKGAANNWLRSKPELRSFFLATEPENPFIPTQD